MLVKREPASCYEYLTPREADVMLCILDRKSDLQIAGDLGVSIHTVKFHKKNIYSKWGVKRRVDAIAFFHRELH